MKPEEKRKELLRKGKEKREDNKGKKLKSFSDLNLEFSKETFEWYKNNR